MRSMAMAFPVRSEFEGRVLQSTSRELGERGILVYCVELPPLRAAVKLTLYLPGDVLEVPATVRSVAGQPPGFWADFDDQTEATHARILRALASAFEQVETPAGGVAKFDPTKPAAGRNRRATPRALARLRVQVDGRDTVTSDLSACGLFAVLENPPAEGTLVRLALDLSDGQPAAESIAVVIRTALSPERGAAMQFAAADDAFRTRLDAYLARR